MNPVLVAAGVLLIGICAFDIMGVLVRMLGGAYPIPHPPMQRVGHLEHLDPNHRPRGGGRR